MKFFLREHRLIWEEIPGSPRPEETPSTENSETPTPLPQEEVERIEEQQREQREQREREEAEQSAAEGDPDEKFDEALANQEGNDVPAPQAPQAPADEQPAPPTEDQSTTSNPEDPTSTDDSLVLKHKRGLARVTALFNSQRIFDGFMELWNVGTEAMSDFQDFMAKKLSTSAKAPKFMIDMVGKDRYLFQRVFNNLSALNISVVGPNQKPLTQLKTAPLTEIYQAVSGNVSLEAFANELQNKVKETALSNGNTITEAKLSEIATEVAQNLDAAAKKKAEEEQASQDKQSGEDQGEKEPDTEGDEGAGEESSQDDSEDEEDEKEVGDNDDETEDKPAGETEPPAGETNPEKEDN